MCAWRPWPYAAKAIIQHEWVVNLLYIWVTFKFAMDQTVKPANGLWLCEADGVPKAVTISAWQDEWTILLTVPDVLALPGRVTLEYDGPDPNLRITWEKQWEPWGPILSVRVPYLWEDILVVDTVNKRVGIQPGVVAAAALKWALSIVSPNGNEQVGLYHDDNHARLKWSKGFLFITTDEGTDTDTVVAIQGKGNKRGYLWVYDQDNAEFLELQVLSGRGQWAMRGTTPVALDVLNTANVPMTIFVSATEGETEKQRLYGWKAGDANQRHVDLQISPNANNTALWSGMAHYVFDGNLRATGALVSGTKTHSAVGPTDDLDVSDVNTVFIDCSGGNVTIGGFVGGVNGQTLNLVRLCAAANDATLEHNEGHGNQNIFLHKGLDETLTGEYGGWTLVCDGTSWFDASHAKHV